MATVALDLRNNINLPPRYEQGYGYDTASETVVPDDLQTVSRRFAFVSGLPDTRQGWSYKSSSDAAKAFEEALESDLQHPDSAALVLQKIRVRPISGTKAFCEAIYGPRTKILVRSRIRVSDVQTYFDVDGRTVLFDPETGAPTRRTKQVTTWEFVFTAVFYQRLMPRIHSRKINRSNRTFVRLEKLGWFWPNTLVYRGAEPAGDSALYDDTLFDDQITAGQKPRWVHRYTFEYMPGGWLEEYLEPDPHDENAPPVVNTRHRFLTTGFRNIIRSQGGDEFEEFK